MVPQKRLFMMLVVGFISTFLIDVGVVVKRKGDIVNVSQVAVGNTGKTATSKSSSPVSANVSTQANVTSVGQPGQPGQVGATTSQVRPNAQPILQAGGTGQIPAQSTPSSIPPIDQNQITSYIDQFRSGALDPQAFTSQLRNYLNEYRTGAVGAIQNKANAARNAVTQTATTVKTPLPPRTGMTTNPGQSGGLSGDLSDAEQWLIERESGGDTSAYNPQSTDSGNAFGLGQLTTANRQRFAAQLGVDPDTTDYNAQLQMMRMYVQERYGSPEAAQKFWQQNGWY